MKQKLVVFSGAGISEASGIETYRDDGGLWYNYDIAEVATKEAWENNPDLVLEFHNVLRDKLALLSPNEAHFLLKELEKDFEVIHITQNLDNFLEEVNCKNILHLHGELNKCRSINDANVLYDCARLNIGDKCFEGYQLRPHSVLFGEIPYNIEESIAALKEADVLIIIGTSLSIGYTINLLQSIKETTEVFYIDSKPDKREYISYSTIYIEKKAIEGIKEFLKIIK